MSAPDLHALRRPTRGADEPSAPRTDARRPGRHFGGYLQLFYRRLTSSPFLIPILLLAGFAVVFFAKFGGRFLPALEVPTAPVRALRAGAEMAGAAKSEDSRTSTSAAPRAGEPALFQATGWIEPDPLPIKATALVGGVVKEVHVLEGQTVKSGDLLATLVEEDVVLDLRQAERKRDTLVAKRKAHSAKIPTFEADIVALDKRISAAEALLEDAEDSADRYSSLTPGSAPDREVRKAALKARAERAVLAALKAERPSLVAELEHHRLTQETLAEEVAEAEVGVARAKLALERTRITSPVDGIVLQLLAVPGQKRMLDMDDPDSATIAILYIPTELQVRVDVPLSEAAGLTVGQPASIRCDLLPDQTYHGTVTRLAGQADLQRNTLQAKVRIDSPDPRLRPEMLCRVKFFALAAEGEAAADAREGRLVLYVPEAAVRRGPNGDGAFVWVASPGGRAERRPVVLGDERREDHISVATGVRPGERVITGQFGDLAPGRRIKARL